jgi:predicted RNA-binding protein with PUA-like domain
MASAGKSKRTGGKKATGTAKKSATKSASKPVKKAAAAKKPAAKGKEGGAWAAVFTPRAPGERRYWLVKSEPSTFSWDDLLAAKDRTTNWNGIRNFAARNFMRDGMKVGDQVLFYHSSVNPQAIVGVCEVVREAYPEPNDPDWCMVDLRAVGPLARPVTLAELKTRPELAGMALLRIGRLSVTPVTPREWEVIQGMASVGT